MPVLQGTRRKIATRQTSGGGNGGNNLSSWKGYGNDDGSYKGAQDKLQQGRGAFTGVLNAFTESVGLDPHKPQLVSSAQAGKAQQFAQTKAPQYVENAKTFYKSAETASDSDLKIKNAFTDFAIHHSTNLVKQQELDHKLARQQMDHTVAQAAMKWETTEHYLRSQGSLEQLAQQTTF